MSRQARHVVRTMSGRVGRSKSRDLSGKYDEEFQFLKRTVRAFEEFSGEDGTMTRHNMEAAVMSLAVGSDEGLPWQLAPLLWRLMDGDREGRVTLKEFVVGQQLLQAASTAADFREDEPTCKEIEELCWRALDVHRDGIVSRSELAILVRLMLHLGAVDEVVMKEIKLSWVSREVWHNRTGRGRSSTVPLEAIDYYMHLYDLDGDGRISRDEFSKCNALQHNFWLLLTKPELKPIFLSR